MAVIQVTVALNGLRNMTKEIPVFPDLQPALSTADGYISSTTISFTHNASAADTINDSASQFSVENFDGTDAEYILVETTSGLNDGMYLGGTDAAGALTLDSGEELVTETAAAAGTVLVQCVAMFRIIPTRPMSKGIIIYSEGIEGGGATGMIPCLLNGSQWAADNGIYTDFAAVTSSGVTHYIWVETAPYVQSDGSLWFFLKPVADADGVYTSHQPAVGFLQLP